MGLRTYDPTSPGRRGYVSVDHEEVTESKPHKPLLRPLKERAGRNTQGRVTVRHRGGARSAGIA